MSTTRAASTSTRLLRPPEQKAALGKHIVMHLRHFRVLRRAPAHREPPAGLDPENVGGHLVKGDGRRGGVEVGRRTATAS
ncbi:hypothetical protein NRF20_25585 [Streptomyces sp. R-74717]|uniref:hypothetical protein n=1 Tax=Streptomyces sp. R-74717 TaxID=2969820 RepID=UPI0039B5EC01